MAAAARIELDLLKVARRSIAWPSLALLAAGLALGSGLGQLRGQTHAAAFTATLPAPDCPGKPGYAPASFKYAVPFPASVIEGFGRLDSSLPAPLRDYRVVCELDERVAGGSATCRVEGADLAEAQRLAQKAAAQLSAEPGASWPVAFTEARLIGACGWDFFEALAHRGPTGTMLAGSLAHDTAALNAVRARYQQGVSARFAPEVADAPQPSTKLGPVLGLLLGLVLAFAFAAWRERANPVSGRSEVALPLVGRGALAVLLLCTSMDTVLNADVHGFTVRLGQLAALVLLGAVLWAHAKAKAPLRVPFAALLAALGYLFVMALSGVWSHNPTKTVGYLLWAGFDLAAVLVGLLGALDTEEKLAKALRLWVLGMLASAAMGGVQLVSWLLGFKPPLVWMTVDGFPRINGFSYEPSYFCLYLLPGAALLMTRFALLGRRALGSGVLAGALVLAVGLSTSRSGWIGVGAVVLLLVARAWLRLGIRGLARVGGAAAAMAVLFALVLLAWPQMRMQAGKLARMAVDRFEESSTGPRIESARQALVLTARHPVLGVGFGGYGGYVLDHPELPQPNADGPSSVVTTNLYLELAAETGLVGLAFALATLLLLFAPLVRSVRGGGTLDEGRANREGLFVAALVVFGVQYQFSQTLWRLDTWTLVALFSAAGLLAAGREAGATGQDSAATAGRDASATGQGSAATAGAEASATTAARAAGMGKG